MKTNKQIYESKNQSKYSPEQLRQLFLVYVVEEISQEIFDEAEKVNFDISDKNKYVVPKYITARKNSKDVMRSLTPQEKKVVFSDLNTNQCLRGNPFDNQVITLITQGESQEVSNIVVDCHSFFEAFITKPIEKTTSIPEDAFCFVDSTIFKHRTDDVTDLLAQEFIDLMNSELQDDNFNCYGDLFCGGKENVPVKKMLYQNSQKLKKNLQHTQVTSSEQKKPKKTQRPRVPKEKKNGKVEKTKDPQKEIDDFLPKKSVAETEKNGTEEKIEKLISGDKRFTIQEIFTPDKKCQMWIMTKYNQ